MRRDADPIATHPVASGSSQATTLGLATALRIHTRAVHAAAERSGIVREILRGTASRQGYVLLLRNLVPVYQHMEGELERLRGSPGVGALAYRDLYRSRALESDLEQLAGSDWRDSLSVLPAAERYAQRVLVAASGDGQQLIAHAYTRYLGDLSGGQVLRRLLHRSLGLDASLLSFYEFPGIPDIAVFKAQYRRNLDRAGREIADPAGVLDEALVAFRLNMALSEAVLWALDHEQS